MKQSNRWRFLPKELRELLNKYEKQTSDIIYMPFIFRARRSLYNSYACKNMWSDKFLIRNTENEWFPFSAIQSYLHGFFLENTI